MKTIHKMNTLTIEQKTALAKMLPETITIIINGIYYKSDGTIVLETEWDNIVNRIKAGMTGTEAHAYTLYLFMFSDAAWTPQFATLSEQANAIIATKGAK